VKSLELTLLDGSGHEGSPGWLQNKEGQAGNLTGVSYDWLEGERRPAAKRSKRRRWSLMLGD
jgi:hypothetical protein